MLMNNLMKIGGNLAANIFLKRTLCSVRSKAAVISMAQVKTSEPFRRK